MHCYIPWIQIMIYCKTERCGRYETLLSFNEPAIRKKSFKPSSPYLRLAESIVNSVYVQISCVLHQRYGSGCFEQIAPSVLLILLHFLLKINHSDGIHKISWKHTHTHTYRTGFRDNRATGITVNTGATGIKVHTGATGITVNTRATRNKMHIEATCHLES